MSAAPSVEVAMYTDTVVVRRSAGTYSVTASEATGYMAACDAPSSDRTAKSVTNAAVPVPGTSADANAATLQPRIERPSTSRAP